MEYLHVVEVALENGFNVHERVEGGGLLLAQIAELHRCAQPSAHILTLWQNKK